MAVWNTPAELVTRAVSSVLAYEGEMRLVVVNDGGVPLETVIDPRLIRVDFPRNVGRYHVDAAVAEATGAEWFTAHDADDWSEPGRLSQLMGRNGEVKAGAVVWHYSNGRQKIHHPNPDPNLGLKLRWHNSAVYPGTFARRYLNPAVRLSWDVAMSSIAAVECEVGVEPTPLYHWCQRPGSLTQASGTRRGSKARHQSHRQVREAWNAYLAGELKVPKPDRNLVRLIEKAL